MSLGQSIRQLRQSRGLTQEQLGGGQLSKSFVSLVERDRTKPSVETLVQFARRLGTSVDGLLGQDGHLPETAANSLLVLSREAIDDRDYATATRLIDAVSFLADKFHLAEASREAHLQAAEMAVENREFSKASSILTSVKTACEQEKDHWRLGRSVLLQGWVAQKQGEFPRAEELLEESLAVLRRARASRDPARVVALILLGTVLGHMDKIDAAIRRYEEAAGSEVAKHDRALRGRALWGLGWMQRKLGHLDSARAFLSQAKDAFESAEELGELMKVLHNIGQVEHLDGKPREALRYFHHALRVMERLQRPPYRAIILTEIGRAHISLGELSEAEHFAASALEEARRVDYPVEAAEAQLVLGRIWLIAGNVKTAVGALREVLAVFRERGMQSKVVEASREFGLALKARGAHPEAAEFLAQVVESGSARSSKAPA